MQDFGQPPYSPFGEPRDDLFEEPLDAQFDPFADPFETMFRAPVLGIPGNSWSIEPLAAARFKRTFNAHAQSGFSFLCFGAFERRAASASSCRAAARSAGSLNPLASSIICSRSSALRRSKSITPALTDNLPPYLPDTLLYAAKAAPVM